MHLVYYGRKHAFTSLFKRSSFIDSVDWGQLLTRPPSIPRLLSMLAKSYVRLVSPAWVSVPNPPIFTPTRTHQLPPTPTTPIVDKEPLTTVGLGTTALTIIVSLFLALLGSIWLLKSGHGRSHSECAEGRKDNMAGHGKRLADTHGKRSLLDAIVSLVRTATVALASVFNLVLVTPTLLWHFIWRLAVKCGRSLQDAVACFICVVIDIFLSSIYTVLAVTSSLWRFISRFAYSAGANAWYAVKFAAQASHRFIVYLLPRLWALSLVFTSIISTVMIFAFRALHSSSRSAVPLTCRQKPVPEAVSRIAQELPASEPISTPVERKPQTGTDWTEYPIAWNGSYRYSRFRPTDLELVATLGSGGFGCVYKARDKVSGNILAVKGISKNAIEGERGCMSFVQETRAHLMMEDNAFFPALLGAFVAPGFYVMIMPCYARGDLWSLIQSSGGRLSRARARAYGAELLVAIHALHTKGIIHRDLKPGNILIDDDGHLVITDFGVSHIFDPLHYPNLDKSHPRWTQMKRRGGDDFPPLWPTNNPHISNEASGTQIYAAPEVFASKQYSYGIDYWSMGVVIYEMITGKLPLKVARDGHHILPVVLDLDRSLSPSRPLDSLSKCFLQKLFSKVPDHRPSVSRMKRDDYFYGINWAKVAERA